MLHALTALNSRQNVGFLIRALRRNKHLHRFAHRLRYRVAEHLLGAVIPGGDHPVQGFADNGIVGRLDHGRQAFAHFLRPLALGNVGADGYILLKLSIRARESNNRAVDPVEGAILGAVPNLAAPYSALSDGAVHLLEEFLGVVAGV